MVAGSSWRVLRSQQRQELGPAAGKNFWHRVCHKIGEVKTSRSRRHGEIHLVFCCKCNTYATSQEETVFEAVTYFDAVLLTLDKGRSVDKHSAPDGAPANSCRG